jgi:hypothetical protein
MQVLYLVGDLTSGEKHFREGLKFFEKPEVTRVPVSALLAFSVASWNAWTLGQADVARNRQARMMAVENTNPYNLALSAFCAAVVQVLHRRVRSR